MKIELTIKTTYLPDWGFSEGVREIIQNAKDAETDGFPMNIKIKNNKLIVENFGATLQHECLLFGHTTKNITNHIGKFGEGLKLGTLALVRSGRKVTIRSGDEIWKPTIEESQKFKSEVLVFNVSKSEQTNSVTVEIECSKEEWEQEKQKFLFLNPLDNRIFTDSGTILLDESLKGKIFVKGIFVQDSELNYGYDLNAQVDRDRKMVNTFDLEYSLYNVWTSQCWKNEEHVRNLFFELLKEDAKDLAYFQKCFYIDAKFSEWLRNKWISIYGEKVYPVIDEAHAKELEYLGARGVVCGSKSLVNIYTLIFGKKDMLKRELANSIVESFSFSDLKEEERQVLNFSLYHVKRAVEEIVSDEKWIVDKLEDVSVVNFTSPLIKGLFKEYKISIARHLLKDYSLTTEVLVHEVSHCFGGDGEKNHDDVIQLIWRTIFKNQIEDTRSLVCGEN